jgi:hypothetical protein
VLNRKLRADGLAPVNHKRVYRIMKAHNLLLARKYTERPEQDHDGKVVVMRSNLRSPMSLGPSPAVARTDGATMATVPLAHCSGGFEFTCWNGAVVRGALDHCS